MKPKVEQSLPSKSSPSHCSLPSRRSLPQNCPPAVERHDPHSLARRIAVLHLDADAEAARAAGEGIAAIARIVGAAAVADAADALRTAAAPPPGATRRRRRRQAHSVLSGEKRQALTTRARAPPTGKPQSPPHCPLAPSPQPMHCDGIVLDEAAAADTFRLDDAAARSRSCRAPARSTPIGRAATPCGRSAAAPCVVEKLPVMIDGGSEVRPMITISGSDCTLAGRPPGGRKKLAGRRTSSEIVLQRFAAQSRADESHAPVPWQGKAELAREIPEAADESPRGVQKMKLGGEPSGWKTLPVTLSRRGTTPPRRSAAERS